MGTGYVRNDTANGIANTNVIDAALFDGEYDAIQDAFSTSGHTHDGTTGEGGPVSVLGPAQDFIASATGLTPKSDNVYTLGTDTLRFSSGFFDALDAPTLTTELGNLTSTTVLPISLGGTGGSTAAAGLTSLGFTATLAELNYMDGVTSSVQTQLDTIASSVATLDSDTTSALGLKADKASPSFTGTASFDAATISGDFSLGGTTITATGPEINKLDGFTGTASSLNYAETLRATGVTATEFNRLDGLTSSTAELNKLDGFTGTASSLNYAETLRATGVTATEFNRLDGLVSSATDLNKLNGFTGTTTHLNRIATVTSNVQSQLNTLSARDTTSVYRSGALTITSGGLVTVNHGLGGEPDSIMFILQCVTADHGWSPGDRIYTELNSTSANNSRYNTSYLSSTQASVRFTSAAQCFAAGNKTSGGTVGLTNSYWRLYIVATRTS